MCACVAGGMFISSATHASHLVLPCLTFKTLSTWLGGSGGSDPVWLACQNSNVASCADFLNPTSGGSGVPFDPQLAASVWRPTYPSTL